jgi:hypothetical protein
MYKSTGYRQCSKFGGGIRIASHQGLFCVLAYFFAAVGHNRTNRCCMESPTWPLISNANATTYQHCGCVETSGGYKCASVVCIEEADLESLVAAGRLGLENSPRQPPEH